MRSTVASSDSILSRWGANSSPTKSTLARASSMICAHLGRRQPPVHVDQHRVELRGREGQLEVVGPVLLDPAMRSLAFTPAAASALASWLLRSSSSRQVTSRSPKTIATWSGRSDPCSRTIPAMLAMPTSNPPVRRLGAAGRLVRASRARARRRSRWPVLGRQGWPRGTDTGGAPPGHLPRHQGERDRRRGGPPAPSRCSRAGRQVEQLVGPGGLVTAGGVDRQPHREPDGRHGRRRGSARGALVH